MFLNIGLPAGRLFFYQFGKKKIEDSPKSPLSGFLEKKVCHLK
jgi:hypothetical protein